MDWAAAIREKYLVRNELNVWNNDHTLAQMDLANSSRRYTIWASKLQQTNSLPTEYLLPTIRVPYRDKLTTAMLRAEERYRENPDWAGQLSRQHWGYYFYLGGSLSTADKTPFFRPRMRAQILLRMQMINDIVEAIVGEEKAVTTVLDMGCNWGGFAIDLALRGFKHVTGFDFRIENISKAKKLARYMQADNVEFQVQNVYSMPETETDGSRVLDRVEDGGVPVTGFDIVYNLGLLYHVTDPVRLVELTHKCTRRVAVFDTVAHKEPVSAFLLGHLSAETQGRPGMGERRAELHPTYRALIELIQFAGFRELIEIVAEAGDPFPGMENDPYFKGLRRVILAFK